MPKTSQPTKRKIRCAIYTRKSSEDDLEGVIEERLTTFLSDDAEIFNAVEPYVDDIGERKRIIGEAATLAKRWVELNPSVRKTMLQTIVHRIEVHPGNVIIKLRLQHLAEVVDPDLAPSAAATSDDQ